MRRAAVDAGVKYDPVKPPVDTSPKLRRSWLRALLAPGDVPPPAPLELEAPVAVSEPTLIDPAEMIDLAVLATQLAELIASARGRLDGAVAMVDRQAEEAATFGQALAVEARAMDQMPPDIVSELLDLTRTMIERTAAAEERLRATNGELRALQHDLGVAQECAERDPLTGLPNRRALEAALTRAVATAHSADAALAVAFCDIDNFKRLNDIHGHAVGDRVLRLVADCLSEGAGDHAFIGRQGGEEFVLLFEGVGALDAAARVDQIRAGLAARSLRSRSDGTPIGQVTFSAGVAGLVAGENGEDMLRRADTALYRAKGEGRNQVVIDAGG